LTLLAILLILGQQTTKGSLVGVLLFPVGPFSESFNARNQRKLSHSHTQTLFLRNSSQAAQELQAG